MMNLKYKSSVILLLLLASIITAPIKTKANEVNKLFNSIDSIGSRSIAAAEGNRSPEGKWRKSLKGHTDPGNQAFNQGFCSYNNSRGKTLDQANNYCLTSLDSFIEKNKETLSKFDKADLNIIAINAADLYNQAPLAGNKFLSTLAKTDLKNDIRSQVIKARVLSFTKPNGNLSAKGLEKICRQYSFYRNQLKQYSVNSYNWIYNCIKLNQEQRFNLIEATLKNFNYRSTTNTSKIFNTDPVSKNVIIVTPVANKKYGADFKIIFPLDGMNNNSTPTDIPGSCRPLGKCKYLHEGSDWGWDAGAYVGAPVRAIMTGVISEVTNSKSGGILAIESITAFNKHEFRYVHLNKNVTKRWRVGDKVNQGDIIGEIAYYGKYSGSAPHFHLEHRVNGILDKYSHKTLVNNAVPWQDLLNQNTAIAKAPAIEDKINNAKVNENTVKFNTQTTLKKDRHVNRSEFMPVILGDIMIGF